MLGVTLNKIIALDVSSCIRHPAPYFVNCETKIGTLELNKYEEKSVSGKFKHPKLLCAGSLLHGSGI